MQLLLSAFCVIILVSSEHLDEINALHTGDEERLLDSDAS